MSTAAQIKRIHTLKSKAGLKDHEYRELLLVHGGRSSKDLDEAAAERLIAGLGKITGATGPAPAIRATGRFAPKLQSLWISGHNLGVIRDRSDRAMLAYVEGQTGVSHTRFLNDAAVAMPAIEGLKGWIGREGGVRWPPNSSAREQAKAVAEAIATRLLALGDSEVGMRPVLFGVRHGLPVHTVSYTTRDFHTLGNLLGERLRDRLAKAGRAA